ncbi:transporter substrate-binding domain-containing protein [Acetobacterium woodii]|uniref:Glutamine ABC transport system substrate binding protein GlnH1 n=1 Tax=Acetobacterium woodii (strain ATCC 29683 / DSM 1030 / JCM 2381 / KCTC 1655 / WB1) TaxID=931626 RepID=H6LGC5_ACEWD|nr:transporter substrate-binding domain-containing protein [Acetobacterium woodii]AFA47061.1 glutamine ABC transport system substrate binding protein GlnH1 [Acetobacterium woodii DSM 1030]
MKKITKIGVLVMLVAITLSLAACSSGTKTSSDTKKYVIATDTTFKPFEYENDKGERVGIDMDLLAAIAKDQGFEYELKAVGFDAALGEVSTGQSDGMIAGMSITDDRKKTFDFSDPYFDSGVVMAVSASNNTIKSYEDLRGQKVAVKNGTEGAAFAESIKDQYGFTTVSFPDSANMYEDVKAGNSVALFEDYPVVGDAIATGVPLKMVTEMEKGSSYGFAVKKGENAELLEMFNAGLTNLKANGEYQKILDTYIKK